MRILITGCNSFTGKHLCAGLQKTSQAPELHGLLREGEGPPGVIGHRADLRDADSVARSVAAANPDRVFHLAGVRTPDADLAFQVNVQGTAHLLDACANLASRPRVIVTSSASVYGAVPEGSLPVRETEPLRPLGAYGSSKAAMEALIRARTRTQHLDAVIVRPFNLIGPGLPAGLAATDFLLQARTLASSGAEPKVRVGNLAAVRDLVDVRDVVSALDALATHPGASGRVYNIATGVGVSMETLFHAAFAHAGLRVQTESDPSRMRPADIPALTGDATRLHAATGWTAQITWEQSLADLATELDGRP